MARRIRSKEAQVTLIVSGVRKGGSFKKLRNLTITPDAEISKTHMVGEKRANLDIDIKAVDFSGQIQALDHDWWQVWQTIQDAEETGNELPEITLVVTLLYRGNPGRSITLHGDLIFKLDSAELPDNEFINVNLSGSCQYADG